VTPQQQMPLSSWKTLLRIFTRRLVLFRNGDIHVSIPVRLFKHLYVHR
jgi:hypothetical protein